MIWVRGGSTFCDKCGQNDRLPSNALTVREFQRELALVMARHVSCGVTTPNVIR